MQRVAQSIIPFCIRAWYVLGSVAMTIFNPDPLIWLHERGIIPAYFLAHVTDVQRQIVFAVALIILMFVWFHNQRVVFEDKKPATPDMPLHEAARYIARDSVWAASRSPATDDRWVIDVDRELMSKLTMGHVWGFGRYKPDHRPAHNSVDTIPFDFFQTAEWYSYHLVTDDPPTQMWRHGKGGGIYWNVMLNRQQVEAAWPRRSLVAGLFGRSPVERLGYAPVFAKQDANYKRLLDGSNPLSAFDEIFGNKGHA